MLLLGVALYIVKILASPDGFTFSDEYVHLRNVNDILRTHHLFANNPLLPTAAYYPGLGAVTAALAHLTGLSVFVSGLLVVGMARLVLVASLFLVAFKVTKSDRAASMASLIYMANPMFLFFGATFSYENLALPLAAFAVWWIASTLERPKVWSLIAAAVIIVAVTITHHVVGLALSALLLTWWSFERRSRPRAATRHLGLLAAISTVATLTWLFAVARPAATYLFSKNIFPALQSTGSLIVGHQHRRQLYASGGLSSPKWETLVGFVAVALLLIGLLFALRRTWSLRYRAPIVVAGAIALLYPFSLIPRLAPTGVAISGRSSEYIFLGLGCVLGLLLIEAARRPNARGESAGWSGSLGTIRLKAARNRTGIAALLLTIVFVGNVTVGTAFYERLTETARPSGYPWLVQPDVITASNWARLHLGIDQPFGASSTDAYVLATAGEQNPISKDRVWPIYFAPTMDDTVVRSIKGTGVRYLLLDWRMTRGVPPSPGYYFSPQEPGAGKYQHAFPSSALRKFTGPSACTHVLYSTGEIQIIDVSAIGAGTCMPRQVGS